MHNFIEKQCPNIYNKEYEFSKIKYKICEKCKLEILSIYFSNNISNQRYFINAIEIFKDINPYNKEYHVDMTCEEFIIKNIIE